MSKQIVIADSTQLQTFCECPTMWLHSFHDNITLEGSIKDDIKMGTMGHKWLEIYYRSLGIDGNLQNAVAAANAINFDELDKVDAEGFPLDKAKRSTVIDRLQLYWMKYSKLRDFIPICKQKHAVAFNSEGVPYDCYEKVPLVEQGFSYELLNTSEYLFVLEGRIDLLTEVNGTFHWVDHKFQSREHDLYQKSIQFRNYSLATNCSVGVINYIRLHKAVSDSTLERVAVSFGSAELRAWRSELIDIFVSMAKSMKKLSDQKSYAFERNRSACAGKWGYPCQYTPICEEPLRQVGDLIKVQKYIQKKEWRPW